MVIHLNVLLALQVTITAQVHVIDVKQAAKLAHHQPYALLAWQEIISLLVGDANPYRQTVYR